MKHLWTLIDKSLNKEQKECYILDKEHHYLSRVLRLKTGDKVSITNGDGLIAKGNILEIKKKETKVEVQELKSFQKKDIKVELWQALIKRHSLEALVSNMSELGVDGIKIFKSLVSQSKSDVKIEKLESLCYESLRINKSPWLCHIEIKKSLEELINEEKKTLSKNIVILCDELLTLEKNPSSIYTILKKNLLPETEKIIIVIGCESGLDLKERNLLSKDLETYSATLGSCILRAQNAALSAVSNVISYLLI